MLTGALQRYADEVSRVEWQKKRLMAQVLVLEAKAEEYRREAEAAKAALEEERRRRAAAAGGGALALARSPLRTPRSLLGADEWEAAGTPTTHDRRAAGAAAPLGPSALSLLLSTRN